MGRAVFTPNHAVARAVERTGLSPSLVIQRTKGWAKVHEEGRCRMCLRPSSVRPLTRHHLLPLAWFRRRPKRAPLANADANIVPLCWPCHCAVEEIGSHARVELRRSLGAAEIAFVIAVAGQAWVDRRYPPAPTVKSIRRASQA
jgi:hypothetical protein